jgi:FkbM family methyltransferase
MKKDSHFEPYEFFPDVTPLDRVAVVCGNGPSLRGFDFKTELTGYDVFGMNAAYRHWDKIGWYPTYYSCLDTVVGMSHKAEIARLIRHKDEYGIRCFLLRANLARELGRQGITSGVINYDAWLLRKRLLRFPGIMNLTTGSHTLLWAAFLGYREIVLLGIDGNYVVEILPEAVLTRDVVLELKDTPMHNPNYFFDGYQQRGDKYNIPNPKKNAGEIIHQTSWQTISNVLYHMDVIVVNANLQSHIDAFPKCAFDQAERTLQDLRDKQAASRNAAGYAGLRDRGEGIVLDEVKILESFLPEKFGVMFDVGAHVGGACLSFLQKGYTVHAFEPLQRCRAALLFKANAAGCRERLHLDARAVSNVGGQRQTWYTMDDSSGASSMLAFTNGHKKAANVTTVTLRDYCREQCVTRIDFLKIDAEGYDLMVLQGFPFESLKPQCVMCEFEDKKTCLLGYTVHDMIKFLRDRGYYLLVSEWHPIARYGGLHQWRRVVPYPTECQHLAWGNVLAFSEKPDEVRMKNIIVSCVSQQLRRKDG